MNSKKSPLKIIIPLVLLLIAVAGGVTYYLKKNGFIYAGTIEATKVDISSQVAARIERIPVEEGEHIKKDQLLLGFSGEDIRLAADLANSNYVRAHKLFQAGSIPQENFDQLKFKKQDADLRVSWLSIVSPTDGTLLSRYHEPGEWVSTGTRLFTLADLSQVWTHVYVPQTLLVKLKLGDPVDALIPEIKKTIPGKIIRISEEAEFTPKNVQTREERTRLIYAIKIGFENTSGLLKPGMSVEVSFKLE